MTNELCISRKLYLDLLKRALTNWTHGHEEYATIQPSRLGCILKKKFFPAGSVLMQPQRFDKNKRQNGQDWPAPLFAHTMIGINRLNNLQECIEQVIADNIDGDLIETGVWKGGASIFMRGVLKVYNQKHRKVFVADSFQGLPPPNIELYPEDTKDTHYTIDELKVSLEQVKENFDAYGLLDAQVVFLKGWFNEVLPTAPINKLAILRLDGDMYGSTMDVLNALYEKLSIGGYLIIDDYCLPPCKKAVADFRNQHNITEEIIDIDGAGAFWRKANSSS